MPSMVFLWKWSPQFTGSIQMTASDIFLTNEAKKGKVILQVYTTKMLRKNWLWFVSNVMRSPSGSYACTMYTTNPAAAPFFTRATWLLGSKTGASSFTFFIQTCNSISSAVPCRDAVTYQQKQLQTDDPDGFTSRISVSHNKLSTLLLLLILLLLLLLLFSCLISHFFQKTTVVWTGSHRSSKYQPLGLLVPDFHTPLLSPN